MIPFSAAKRHQTHKVPRTDAGLASLKIEVQPPFALPIAPERLSAFVQQCPFLDILTDLIFQQDRLFRECWGHGAIHLLKSPAHVFECFIEGWWKPAEEVLMEIQQLAIFA